jgi:hypothetical protein
MVKTGCGLLALLCVGACLVLSFATARRHMEVEERCRASMDVARPVADRIHAAEARARADGGTYAPFAALGVAVPADAGVAAGVNLLDGGYRGWVEHENGERRFTVWIDERDGVVVDPCVYD